MNDVEIMKIRDINIHKFMKSIHDYIDRYDVIGLKIKLLRSIDIFEENDSGKTALQYAEEKLKNLENMEELTIDNQISNIESIKGCIELLKKAEDAQYKLFENENLLSEIEVSNKKFLDSYSNIFGNLNDTLSIFKNTPATLKETLELYPLE